MQADYLRGERSEDKPFGPACDRVPESDSPSWRHGGGMEEANSNDILEEFSSVFQGLGNIGEPYDIKLKPDAKPYALFTPRNIPLPLRPRVEEELQRMDKLGVISKVDTPPWCAGLVVVPKKNGKVRLCVDMQPLNKHVLREVHPLPKVDEP